MISFEGIKELDSYISQEEMNKLQAYIDRYFSDKNLSNAQLENCIKLSNYVKRNNLFIGDIEAEKILENKKVSTMFKILDENKILLRVGQYFNLSTLLELYCAKNNVELTRDSETSLYDKFSHDIDIVRLYLNEIGEFKVLNSKEECELSRLSKKGDIEAREKLINHNLRLVVSIAKNFRNCGVDYPDLIQFGNEGLLVAISKFDENKGYRFSTYATYWIRQAITRGIAMTSRNIRVSVGLHEIIIKIRKAIGIYILTNNGRIPNDNELSEIINVPIDRVKQARECMEMTVSISTPTLSEDKEVTLEDTIPDTTNQMDERIEQYYLNKYLDKLIDIASLNEREQYVLKARNGFFGKIHTLEEIGQKYGCTREWARQIELKSLEKLRSASNVLETYNMLKKYSRKSNNNKSVQMVFRYNI